MDLVANFFENTSPYHTTKIGPRFRGYYTHRTIPTDDSDYELEIEGKYHERPGQLAHDLFGNRDLWWVFITMNRDKMTDPIYGLQHGLIITVPKRDRLLELLN